MSSCTQLVIALVIVALTTVTVWQQYQIQELEEKFKALDEKHDTKIKALEEKHNTKIQALEEMLIEERNERQNNHAQFQKQLQEVQSQLLQTRRDLKRFRKTDATDKEMMATVLHKIMSLHLHLTEHMIKVEYDNKSAMAIIYTEIEEIKKNYESIEDVAELKYEFRNITMTLVDEVRRLKSREPVVIENKVDVIVDNDLSWKESILRNIGEVLKEIVTTYFSGSLSKILW